MFLDGLLGVRKLQIGNFWCYLKLDQTAGDTDKTSKQAGMRASTVEYSGTFFLRVRGREALLYMY